MDQPQVSRAGHFVDAGNEGADVAHAQLVLGPIAVAVEILAEGPQVEEEDGDVQPRFVLLGQDGFLGGGHAADRRAVGVVAAVVARAHALDEGQPAGGLAVGGAADVALRGTGGREHPLELHAGEHVGGQPVAELAAAGGVEGLETGREDHAPDFQFELLDRLVVVDRAGLADLGAQAALAGREMDAVVAVDDRHPRRGLRMGQVDRGPGSPGTGHSGLMQLGPPGTDRGQVDGAGRADEDAGPAGLALIARFLEAVLTRRLPPRPNMLIAPRAMRSLQVRTHRPQRMHLPSAAFSSGVLLTPSSAANSANSCDCGASASSISSTVRRDSLTASVSVRTIRPSSTG